MIGSQRSVGRLLERWRWIWAFLGTLVVWIVTFAVAGHGAFPTLTAAGEVGVFLALVGIGQLFVITAGNGNIDLSIAYVMTLSGFVADVVMNGHNGGPMWLGIGAGLVCGVAAAVCNMIAILLLRMPPIVATLAVGFLADSAAEVLAHSGTAGPSPALTAFTSQNVIGLPLLALCGIALAIVAAVVLHRTVYGRSLQAVGQRLRAAELAGIRVDAVVAGSYLISGVLAALGGVLLAAYSGGAALDIATQYQLGSIAVVVLGGSLILGGLSNVSGVWGAALFLTLLVTMLNVLHLSAAWQDILEGALIIAVLSIAGGGRRQRA